MIPQWHSSIFNIAAWNRFGRPTTPIRTGFVMDDWWIDPTLATKTDTARKSAP
jgi:microcin C transport system substrate-binding protein